MERAAPDKIPAPLLKRDARRFDEAHQRDLPLQPLKLVLRDSGHQRLQGQKAGITPKLVNGVIRVLLWFLYENY
jgi:hypothetical protein